MSGKNKHGLGRDIPADAKKMVRERCNFGCVMCGTVPVHYDHFAVPFAEAHYHDPDDIILLCDHHHRLKTANLIDVEDVKTAQRQREARGNKTGFILPATKRDFRVRWPHVDIETDEHQILIGAESILKLTLSEDPLQPVLINAMFNDLKGNPICDVIDNEFQVYVENVGDFTIQSNRFTYKTPENRVALEFELSSTGLQISRIFHVAYDSYVFGGSDFIQVGNSQTGLRLINCRARGGAAAFYVRPARQNFDFSQASIEALPIAGIHKEAGLTDTIR